MHQIGILSRTLAHECTISVRTLYVDIPSHSGYPLPITSFW